MNYFCHLFSFKGKAFTAIEPEHSINGMCLAPLSGLILTANETPRLGVYFIPVSSGYYPLLSDQAALSVSPG